MAEFAAAFLEFPHNGASEFLKHVGVCAGQLGTRPLGLVLTLTGYTNSTMQTGSSLQALLENQHAKSVNHCIGNPGALTRTKKHKTAQCTVKPECMPRDYYWFAHVWSTFLCGTPKASRRCRDSLYT